MLNLVSKITIDQQPTTSYPNRRNEYVMDFIHDCEINSSWKNLTTTAKLIFPKNLYLKINKEKRTIEGKDIYGTESGVVPIFLRGDKIKVELGYYYKPSVRSQYITQINTEFEGYITKINPKIPLEIECEDNMWLLKQAQCPNKVFPASQYNVQSILQYLLQNASVTPGNVYIDDTILPQLKQINVINGVGTSENIQTNVGDFRTMNETIAQVLMRLRKDYKLECFFRGNDLYCSGIVYYPSDYINSFGKIYSQAYDFQNNIINGNDLNYIRKDDMRLGIVAYSVDKKELTTLNSAGKKRTKHTRLEVKVGDTDGEIRTQYFWNVSDTKTLTDLATQRLNKLKYEGWRGAFTSFGLPFVRHGQAVSLRDNVLPERNGTYLVKGIKVNFGVNGFRRNIDLHVRIDNQYELSDFINGL